jgi:uncharacterized protein involved in outer membrane biogenesis
MVLVLLAGLLLALALTVDLGRFDSRIEAIVSTLLDREFRADGPLSISIGRTIGISASDVYLASTGWDDAGPMLVARRIEASIRTASLLKGPIRFEQIEVEGLRLRLVSNDAGDVNWDFGADDKPGKDDAGRRAVEPPVIMERIDVSDSAVALMTPDTTIEIMIRAIEHAARDERLVTRISGSVNDVPLSLEGDIGPRLHVRSGGEVTFSYAGSLGEIDFEAAGSSDDLLEPRQPSLDIEVRGPNVEYLFDVLGINQFTSGPLDVSIDLRRADGQTQLAAEGQVGEFSFRGDGYTSDLRTFEQASISVTAKGPNIDSAGRLFGFDRLPEAAFSIDGRVGKSGDEVTLEDIELEIADAVYSLAGRIQVFAKPGSANVVLHGRGSDIAQFRKLLGVPGLLTGPFDLTAKLEAPVDYGERIELDGQVAGISLDVDLFPSIEPGFVGTRAAFNIRGPSLATIGEAAGVESLPGLAFTLAGSAEYLGDRVRVDGVSATLAEAKAGATGIVDVDFPGSKTSLSLSFETPSLAGFLDAFGVEDMPDTAVELESQLQVRYGELRLAGIESKLGNGRLSGSAAIALKPFASAIDFDIEARDINLQAVVPATDAYAPADLPLRGRIDARYSGDQIILRRAVVEAGAASVSANGVLDLPPDVTGTALSVFADVPNLAALGSSDRFVLPALPLTLNSRFDGKQDVISARDISMTIGDNLIAADFTYVDADKPGVELRLSAPVLDMRHFMAQAAEKKEAASRTEKRSRVIPDLDLPVHLLGAAKVDIEIDIGSFSTHQGSYRDVILTAALDDRGLVVERFGLSGRRGRIHGEMAYKPDADDWHLDAAIRGDELVFAPLEEPEEQLRARPEFSLDAEFDGRGANVRDLLATLDGRVLMHSDDGVLPTGSRRVMRLLFGDFGTELLQAVNPLAESSGKTRINCAVLMLHVDGGVVTGDPAFVMQTDMLNIFGKGKIDLATEDLDLDFNTQQRKGVGLSLGDLVNPYTKVGGTLASPVLELDTTGALVEGGAAFATGGLTVIAKALRNRFLSNRDPCGAALETYRKAVEAASD